MIIGPAGFMYAPKNDDLTSSPSYHLDELYIGQHLRIRVGYKDARNVEVTAISHKPDVIHDFNWKDSKGRTGWAHLDQIL